MELTLKKINCFLLVVSTVFLIYWPRVYHEGFFIPLRYDLIFAITIFCFGIEFLWQLVQGKMKLDKVESKIYLTLFVLVMTVLLATFISFIRYDLSFNLVGITTLCKLCLGVGVFFAIYRTMKQQQSHKFYKLLSWSLIFPSLLLIPFVFLPNISAQLKLISPGYRFQGFTTNPAAMNLLVIIAFSYLYSFFVMNVFNKGVYFRSVLYLILIMGIGGVIFWSQSRSFIIAMFLISFFTPLFYGLNLKLRLGKVMAFSLLGSIIVASSFFLIPDNAQKYLIIGRIMGVTDEKLKEFGSQNGSAESKTSINYDYDALIKNVSTKNINKYDISIQSISSVLWNDPRVTMWKYFLPLIPKNPLGLGVNYQPSFNYKWIYALPPVFILNVWACGGIIAVFCVSYLFWLALVRLKNDESVLRNNELLPYRVGAVSALIIAWFISFFYGLPLEYIGFWIISALALL